MKTGMRRWGRQEVRTWNGVARVGIAVGSIRRMPSLFSLTNRKQLVAAFVQIEEHLQERQTTQRK